MSYLGPICLLLAKMERDVCYTYTRERDRTSRGWGCERQRKRESQADPPAEHGVQHGTLRS